MESGRPLEVLGKRQYVFFCLSVLVFLTCVGPHGLPPVSAGEAGNLWSKVPTVVAPKTDPRVPVVREAVDCGNRTFAELGAPCRFGTMIPTTAPVSVAALQALSTQGVGRGGRGELPESLQGIPDNLLVVLSEGECISFAARASSGAKVVVGLKSHHLYPLTLPHVTRNVIAHAVGHAVGLGHNEDPPTRMCGRPAPCRPEVFRSHTAQFFPLPDAEKARLMLLYPST